jgi:5-methylphenazine-1-carboxylate 1-monooxygenase
MPNDQVLIAGGGIGGLTLALTLHQIGVPCTVFECAPELQPTGVGINLQPNAVRELEDLGIGEAELGAVGIPAREWALVALNGKEIHSEPRGKHAGYRWHQYALHRGRFHQLLYRAVLARLGSGALKLAHTVTGYRNHGNGRVTALIDLLNGTRVERSGALLVGADGIHSRVRAQMHPSQPPIHWGGKIMWRGTARGVPIRTGSSFVGLGTSSHRVVLYPISERGEDGLADINWIAEKTLGIGRDWTKTGWFRPAAMSDFIGDFEHFVYDWLDLRALLSNSDTVYENPMIDRDPIATWVDGAVGLMGDAAHPMYPTGSNGASQAIVDARVIGRMILDHGVTPDALTAYDLRLCDVLGKVAIRNRADGPFGLLELVEDRCGGKFDEIDDVISEAERADFMLRYQQGAGFDRDALNAALATIPAGARVRELLG